MVRCSYLLELRSVVLMATVGIGSHARNRLWSRYGYRDIGGTIKIPERALCDVRRRVRVVQVQGIR